MSDWSKVTRPIPVPNEWTKPFWDAARRGVLELQRCQSCGHFQHPPYATCVQCVSTDLKFEPVRGAGAIYAYTIMYHTGDKRFASVGVDHIESLDLHALRREIVGAAHAGDRRPPRAHAHRAAFDRHLGGEVGRLEPRA